ncbi:MAG: hypothetical protein O3C43_24505 [Verrucomicrobia bacterium]|nr:hypothetical protein [Verrucomicrobiota bacterium]
MKAKIRLESLDNLYEEHHLKTSRFPHSIAVFRLNTSLANDHR